MRIVLNTELNDSKARKQLSELQDIAKNKKLKFDIDIGNLSKVNSELAKINSNLNNAFKMNGGALNNLKLIQSAVKEINNATKGMKVGGSKNTGVDNLINQYKQLKIESASINKQLSKTSNTSEYKALERQLISVNAQIHTTRASMNELTTQTQKNSLKAFDDRMARNLERSYASAFGKIQSDANSLSSKLSTLGKSGYIDKSKLSSITNELQKIKNLDFKNMSSSGLQKYISDLNNLKNKTKELENEAKNLRFQEKLKLDTSKVQSDLSKLRQKCQEVGRSSSDIDKLERELRELNSLAPDKVPTALARIKTEVSGLKSSFSGLASSGRQVNSFFSDLYRSMSTFSLGSMIAMRIQNGIRGIGKTVVDLDSDMVSMMKVAPDSFRGTKEELNQVRDAAIDAGTSVARSSNDIIKGTSKAFQLGIKNVNDALEYARNASQFANVADVNQEDANKYLSSILSSFGGVTNSLKPVREQIKGASKDYNTLTKFQDLANYAGNNFAITTSDVGEALQRSGSMLSGFGVSMQDSIGMIVGAQESVQNAEKVGTGLKTISRNIGGIKAAAKDGSIETNRTAKALKTIAGIDTWNKQTGEVKDMMTTLKELDKVWNTAGFTKDKKLAIADATAGANHINTFMAMMDNFKQVLAYENQFEQGLMVGSAQKENDRFVQSIEGKIVRFKEELKKLTTTLFTSDMFKSVIDGATSFVSVLNNIVSAFDKMGLSTALAIGTIGSLFKTVKAFGTGNLQNGLLPIVGISKVKQAMKAQQSQVTLTNGANVKYTKGMSNLSRGVTVASSSVAKASNSYKSYRLATTQATGAATNLSRTIPNVNKGFVSTAANMAKTGAKSLLLNTGISLLNGAFIGLAVAGISKAISMADEWIHRSENMAKAAQDNIDNIQQEINSYQQQKATISGIADRYDELASKTSKSKEELSEFSDLKNQIAETMPDLVIGYDSNNDPILAMSGSCQSLIDKLDDAISRKNELMRVEKHDLAVANMDNVKDSIDDLKDQKDNLDKVLRDSVATRLVAAYEGDKDKRIKNLREVYNTEQKDFADHSKAMRDAYNKFYEEERTIQEDNIGKLNKNTGDLKGITDKAKQSTYELMDTFNWSEYDVVGQDRMVGNFEKLANSLSSGKINPKSLENVKQQWKDLNTNFQATGDQDKYKKGLEGIANQLARMTNTDASMWLKGLADQFHGLDTLDETKLAKFLDGMGSSWSNLEKGEQYAVKLKQSFQDLQGFMMDFSEVGEFNLDNLIKIDQGKSLQNLPDQIKQAIHGIVADNKIDDVEQELLLDISTVIENGGKIKDDVATQLNDLFKGKLDVSKFKEDGFKIAPNIEIDYDELEYLNKYYKEHPVDVDFKMNPEKLKAQAQEVNGAIENWIKASQDSKDFEIEVGIKAIDTAKFKSKAGIDNLANVLKEIPAEKQVDFVTNTQDTFAKFDNLKDVLANLPPSTILQFHLEGLDGVNTEKVNQLKQTLEGLPENIQSKIDVIGYENIEKTSKILGELGGQNKEAAISFIVNHPEVMGQVENYKQLLEKMQDKDVTVTEKVVGGEQAQQQLQNTEESLDNIDGDEADAKVNVDTEEATMNLETFKEFMKNDGNGNVSLKFHIDTGNATQNLANLNEQVSNFKSGTKKISFLADTAQSAANCRGLETRVKAVPIGNRKTSFFCITAQAARNCRGLEERVKAVPTGTFTTTFRVITSYETKGSPTSASSGIGTTNSIAQPKMVSAPAAFTTPLSQSQASPAISMMSSPEASTMSNTISTPSYASSTPASVFSMPKMTVPIKGSDIFDGVEYDVDILTELNNQIKIVTNSLSKLDTAMEHAVGSQKIKYLQEQNKLYEEQKQLQKELEDKLIRQRNYYEYVLKYKGFTFDNSKTITNEEEKLIAMKKVVKQLEEASKKAQDASSNADSKNESAKKALEDKAKKAQEAYDKEKEKLDEVTKYLTEYTKVQLDELPKCKDEWNKLNNSIADHNKEIRKLQNEKWQVNHDSYWTSIYRDVEEVNNELAMLDVLMENAYGKDKLDLMDQQIELLRKQKKELRDTVDFMQGVRNELTNKLKGFGFEVRDNGTIGNFIQQMNKLKATSEDFDEAEKVVKEYFDLINNKIPDTEKQIKGLDNDRFEAIQKIKKLQNEKWELNINSTWTSMYRDVEEVNNQLEMLDVLLKNAFGREKTDLLERKVDLLERQKKELAETTDYLKQIQNERADKLKEFGFKVRDDGTIANYIQQLNKLKDTSEDFEEAKKIAEEYLDVFTHKIPDAEKELKELDNTIKEVYKNRLEISQKIEKQITEMYKKELEDRKKAIQEETDAKIKALEKEKKAYQDSRAEADYQNDYDEQLKKVNEIQKLYDIAKRDSSEKGQKKVQDLLKQLQDEQKNLDKLVQDKIDKNVNDMYDDEKDRIQDQSDDIIKDLEEKFSDSKIAEMVAEALASGMFEGLDGEVTNLQKKMLEFLEESGDAFGAMGGLIKQEMVGNLKEALDTLKDISDIYDKLDISKYDDFSSRKFKPNTYAANNSSEINFNSPLIVIEGNVDRNMMADLDKYTKKLKKEVYSDILKYKK